MGRGYESLIADSSLNSVTLGKLEKVQVIFRYGHSLSHFMTTLIIYRHIWALVVRMKYLLHHVFNILYVPHLSISAAVKYNEYL